MIFTLITVISLVLLAGCVFYAIIKFFFLSKNREEKIEFLRSFKKGKCAVVYIAALPLYCIGYIYSDNSILVSFFNSVSKCINLVVLRYDLEPVEGLMSVNQLYKITIYFCFILVAINALVFTFSLISQYLWSETHKIGAHFSKKDKLYILGNNPQNISIYLSDKKKRNKVIIDDLSKSDAEKLYIKRILYISTDSYGESVKKIFKKIKKSKKEYVLVVNTGDDDKNIKICQEIIDNIDSIIASDGENKKVKLKDRLFLKTKVFVFGQPRYEAIYETVVNKSHGCIHYINKYQEIAMDFIDKYPFTKFMNEDQIDYETSLIKKDVDINVMLIGFGKTNQQIFLTSVANNQFLTVGKTEPELKKVKYFIFDKENSENNKNLNHNYYRYKHECLKLNQDEYLPFPTLPAKEKYYKLDINDCEFYTRIRKIVTSHSKDVNFIIIAFGTDLENIDMAQKLVAKRKEWGIENLVIFVKARAVKKEDTLIKDEACYFIANENAAVYDIDKIIGDDIFKMAQQRNEVYDLEYDIKNSNVVIDDKYVEKNRENANRAWYMSKTQLERESSLYCCLSLRSKLNLMGLDYCKIDDPSNNEVALSEEEYLAIYAKGDSIDREKYKHIKANGKKIVNYTLEFANSRRTNLAIHEHQRWNSFMISKGIVPATKEQILNEITVKDDGTVKFTNGKNYALRRHGNLTTFVGLVEFRQMVANRDKCDELVKDVIQYDYQILDDAYWLLNSNNFKIFKIQKNTKKADNDKTERMNPFKKLGFRIYQATFRALMPFLPYRQPKKIDLCDIGDVLSDNNKKSVLVVSRRFPDNVKKSLDKKQIKYVVYDKTQPDPTIENVEEALKLYNENNCDSIIAIGGGSPIDCAKAVGACVAYPNKKLGELGGKLKVLKAIPLLIAIPTTAGTGSEVSPAAVIKDTVEGRKYVLMSFPLIPHYTVLDASLTYSLPPHLTATTGMDALTHAIEAYIGRSTTLKSKRLARKAIIAIFENLEKAYSDGQNAEAREKMLLASYNAGRAFSISYVGYIHAISHSVGGKYGIPHGLANAVIMPHVLWAYGKSVHKKLHKLAIAVGISDKKDTHELGARKLIHAIKDLNVRMNIPNTLAQIKEEDLPELAKRAEREANPLYPVPKLMTAKELEKIYYKIKP